LTVPQTVLYLAAMQAAQNRIYLKEGKLCYLKKSHISA